MPAERVAMGHAREPCDFRRPISIIHRFDPIYSLSVA